uniref:Uncharacterized protein LOC111110356 n=1 Tax=Crassostrea virginica TaxID=6565 RepID=A0A8B8BI91_CRAVI|nr:uncharacterized protein LOC111110356 [Crassostrea virginica]
MDTGSVGENVEEEADEFFREYIPKSPAPTPATWAPDDDPDIELDDDVGWVDDESIRHRVTEFFVEPSVQSVQSQPIQNDDVDHERVYVNKIFASECGCSRNCFTLVSSYKEHAYELLLRLREFTKSERDIYILSKLEDQLIIHVAAEGAVSSKENKRERQRFRYSFQGIEICESAWRSVFEIGRSEFKSLKKQLKENGVTPRVHGLKGKKSNHGHPFCVIEAAVVFIKRYADQFGLPLPAAPRAHDDTPPVLLPCNESKAAVHAKYKEACLESSSPYVELTTFKEAWNSCVPFIQFMKPKTDLCKTCFDLRENIAGAFDEETKLELTQRLIDHIDQAKQEREFYKECTTRAKEELQNAEKPHGRYLPSCSAPYENVHYTFDFSQYVTIPHSSQQVGPLFFLQPRKVQIFGVCDENFPLQTNYLIDENETIGENGSKTHGPNAVLSMLHHYFDAKSHGEIGCHLHADNCVGQNKNKTTLHYLAWRCLNRFHKKINLHFMIAGHTKCLCDSCFGMLKKKYRRSEVDGIEQLEQVVEQSAKSNTVARCGELQWFRWDAFFSRYFKPVKGIGKFHHFMFTAEEPGIVYAKQTLDAPEKQIQLFKEGVDVNKMRSEFPEVIMPGGLSKDRVRYLFREIRPYVKAPYKDATCPAPEEE